MTDLVDPKLATTTRLIIVVLLSGTMSLCNAQTVHDRMVGVAGCKLHISNAGSGEPSVVFESGLGEDLETWHKVQPKVALFSHTIAYDRAGLGKSTVSARPKTVSEIAVELHSLLGAAGVPPPYVLVGHSLGGAIVQLFAHLYAREVAGLVLVDPEDGRLNDRLRAHMTPAEWAGRQTAMDAAMPKFTDPQKAEFECLSKKR